MPECQYCGEQTERRDCVGVAFCSERCEQKFANVKRLEAEWDEAMREDYYQERREWLREINEAARVAGEDEVK